MPCKISMISLTLSFLTDTVLAHCWQQSGWYCHVVHNVLGSRRRHAAHMIESQLGSPCPCQWIWTPARMWYTAVTSVTGISGSPWAGIGATVSFWERVIICNHAMEWCIKRRNGTVHTVRLITGECNVCGIRQMSLKYAEGFQMIRKPYTDLCIILWELSSQVGHHCQSSIASYGYL
jgi:hypothetical protein